MNRRSLLTVLFTLLLLAVAAPVVLAELSNEEILKRAKSVANSAQPHPSPETILVTVSPWEAESDDAVHPAVDPGHSVHGWWGVSTAPMSWPPYSRQP